MKVKCNNRGCTFRDCYHKKPHEIVVLEYYRDDTGKKRYDCTNKEEGCKTPIGTDKLGMTINKTSWCELCEMDDEFNNEINRILDI